MRRGTSPGSLARLNAVAAIPTRFVTRPLTGFAVELGLAGPVACFVPWGIFISISEWQASILTGMRSVKVEATIVVPRLTLRLAQTRTQILQLLFHFFKIATRLRTFIMSSSLRCTASDTVDASALQQL